LIAFVVAFGGDNLVAAGNANYSKNSGRI